MDWRASDQSSLLDYYPIKKEEFYKNVQKVQTDEEEVEESSVTISWAHPICLRPPIKLH